MIANRFIRPLIITLEHDYWNHSTPNLFQIEPTLECTQKLRKLESKFHITKNGFELAIQESKLDAYKKIGPLNFKLLGIDPYFKNYTDLFEFNDNEVAHYHVHADNLTHSILPVHRGFDQLLLFAKPKKITDSVFHNILIDLDPEDRLAQIYPLLPSLEVSGVEQSTKYQDALRWFGQLNKWLNAEDDGNYKLEGKETREIIYEKEYTQNLTAWLSVNTEEFIQKTITFPSKKTRLEYVIKSDHYDLAQLSVIDHSKELEPITFSRQVLETEVAFFSDQLINWQEKSERRIHLMNGKSKPLKETLPLCTSKNLKYDKDQNPYLKIFIHL